MKKLAVLVLIPLLLLPACAKKTDLTKYISQLRIVLYEGESDSYKLDAFYEISETPNLSDGEASKKSCRFVVRIKPIIEGDLLVQTEINGKVCERKPLKFKDSLEAIFELDYFIDTEEISASVILAGNKENVTIKRLDTKSCIPYADAVNRAYEAVTDHISGYFEHDGGGEIRVRLLKKNDCLYYYVGFVLNETKTISVLLNAADGEVLATKC